MNRTHGLFPRILPLIVAVVFSTCSLFTGGDSTRSPVYSRTATLARLGEPFGIAVFDGEVYVSDGEAGRIVKVSGDGSTEVYASGLNTPSAIAFSSSGDLFVADTGSHTIRKIGASRSMSTIAGVEMTSGNIDGPAASATFNGPVGIAVADDGVIYVADTYNDRIRVIKDGVVSTLAGSARGFSDGVSAAAKFDTPLGIGMWQGKLLVADSGNHRLRVVEPNGVVWTLAGTGDGGFRDGPPLQAGLASPAAVAIDTAGRIFVADGNAIRVIGRRPFPFVETMSDDRRGYADGETLRARFNRPSGIVIGTTGELLIADSDNQVVRAISDGGIGREASAHEINSYRVTAEPFRDLQQPRWPYDPAQDPREIAGTLGEIRGEIDATDKAKWFHNGLDIAGAYGETAKFIRSETVLDPNAAENVGASREQLRLPTIGYIHLRLGRDKDDVPFGDPRFQFERDVAGRLIGVRVPRGAKFNAGDLLGTLNAMNHVHLIAGRSGSEMNALDALIFPGIGDSIPPVIEKVSLVTPDWREIEGRIKLVDKSRIVVRAYDRMDGNSERRRLGVFKLGYQLIRHGAEPGEINWTIVFDRMPSNDAVGFVYAPGSRSGATGETVFNYIASNRVSGDQFSEEFLEPANLTAGEYVLRIFAADFFGNLASKDLNIEVVK